MATKKTTKKTTEKAKTKSSAATTAAKKAPRKTTKTALKAAAKTTVKTAPVNNEVEVTPETPKQLKIRRSYVALIVAILLIGAGLYYFRGLFVAAVVNGQPISRLEIVRQTEKQSGKQTLDTLVRNALIEQKAKKENVTVSDSEVNTEIKKLEDNLKKQGQTLDQVLTAQGMTQDDLKKLIRLDKLVSKMVGKNVKVTDKEVADYIAKNKESLPSTDEATLKKQVKDQLIQQKTNEKVRTWLADLQKQANIVYFVQY